MRNTKIPSFYSNLLPSTAVETVINHYKDFKTDLEQYDGALSESLPEFCCIELEKVEEYCQYIRKEMDRQGIKSKGIKFIFSRHSNTLDANNQNPLYKNLVHIVLGPADMQALANANTEAIDYPSESEAIKKVGLLNFMNIAPPYASPTMVNPSTKP
jgi:hypothetical protein